MASIFHPIYQTTHYAGSQAQVYIGKYLIDEAVSISYSVSQQKTPIYGYASQLFDVVAPGPVIVQGSLVINYIESGYLWAVLREYKSLEDRVDQYIAWGKAAKTIEASEEGDHPEDILSFQLSQIGVRDDLARSFIEGTVTNEQKIQVIAQLMEMQSKSTSQFKQVIEDFENAIWGHPNLDIKGQNFQLASLDNQARRVDDNKYDNVDIYVAHGDISNPAASHTVRCIRNVHFLSEAQESNPTGDPVLTSYSFLARNLI